MTNESIPRHWIAVAATCLALVAASLSAAYAAGLGPTARASATQSVKDEAHLHLTGTNGSLLIEEGQATGQVPGKVKASFELESSVTSNFTIYARVADRSADTAPASCTPPEPTPASTAR